MKFAYVLAAIALVNAAEKEGDKDDHGKTYDAAKED